MRSRGQDPRIALQLERLFIETGIVQIIEIYRYESPTQKLIFLIINL